MRWPVMLRPITPVPMKAMEVPFGTAVLVIPGVRGVPDQLLEHGEAQLPVVHRVAQLAVLEDPCRRNPRDRDPQELRHLLAPLSRGIRMEQQLEVLLGSHPELLQETAPAARIPKCHENKIDGGIPRDEPAPPAVSELGLAVEAPRRPEVDHRDPR